MREEILNAAEEIVQDKGLDALSFQQLATAVGLGKASVFHHFRNKDALASALIERCRSKYGAQYSEIADREKPALKRLRKIAKSFDKGLQENRLCLLAAMGSSFTQYSENTQFELSDTAQAAIRTFTKIFEDGKKSGELIYAGTAVAAATAYFALLQGLQQVARYTEAPGSFMPAVDAYLKSIEY